MKTIDEVILKLDEIIVWAEKNQSPIGYFAALYRRMTIAVNTGIGQGKFENGPRMIHLDIIFAKRYFDAFDNFQKKKPITKSWQLAFEACQTNQITVIQHLLLGINAHINLDLGVAAAEISTKKDILSFEKDFNQINTIISGLIDDSKMRLTKIWWPFRILTSLLDTESDGMINFSIKVARTFSWENAKALTNIDASIRNHYIETNDKNVQFLAQKIMAPSKIMAGVLWMIRKGEMGSTLDKISVLK